jgi:hypothetical protein
MKLAWNSNVGFFLSAQAICCIDQVPIQHIIETTEEQ